MQCKWLLILVLTILVSCTTTKYVEVPVEVVKTKTEYVDKIQIDSIYVQDSIFIKQVGDTVYSTKVKYLYKNRLKVDTVLKVDSVPVVVKVNVPVEVPKIVEVNKLYTWQKILMWIGGILLLLFLGKYAIKLFLYIKK